MFIAQKLRKQNITAYVLYMFQVEDTIRAYALDSTRLECEYLTRFNYEGQQLKQAVEWYSNLCRMMREEGVTESGHPQVVRNTLMLLADRHQELLEDAKQPFYNAAYYKALPYIVELRARGVDKEKNEMEVCLDALYGVTLLRMQQKDVSAQTLQAIRPIAHLMELLSQLYDKES